MTSKKRFLKVEETLDYINSLEEKSLRKNELLGFRSNDGCKEYKHIISICTSISVVLMQYDLYHIALEVLKKAAENDKKLIKYGSSADKLWIGRLQLFTNLAFLYNRYHLHRLGSIDQSFKFISESQNFLFTLKESNINIHEDLKIGTDILTFIILWLYGQFKHASVYLDSAAKSVNIIIKGTPTKLNKTDIQVLYGLIVSSLGALSVKMGGKANKAIELCEKCAKEFEGQDRIVKVINRVIESMETQSNVNQTKDIQLNPCFVDYNDKNYKFPEIPDDILNSPLDIQEDWLVCKEYQSLLLNSVFYPIISPNTPALRKEELEFEQAKTKLLDIIEDNPDIIGQRHSSSVPRKLSSKYSPQRVAASVLRSRGPSQPWWKNNQFMEKVFKKSTDKNKSVSRIPKRKPKETQNLPPIDSQIQEIYSSRISPRRSVIRKRDAKRSRNNEHIMVEFNPGVVQDGEKVPVTLVPIGLNRKCLN
jgi:hypothetical protein